MPLVVVEERYVLREMCLKTLALCCRDTIGTVCDLYHMTSSDLIVPPEYVVKQIIWECFQGTVYT